LEADLRGACLSTRVGKIDSRRVNAAKSRLLDFAGPACASGVITAFCPQGTACRKNPQYGILETARVAV